MARRERTDEFVGYRLKHRRGLMKHAADGSYSINLAPAWMEDVHDVEYDLQRIENRTNELSGLHRKQLLPTFSYSDVDDGTDEVDALTAEITKLYQSTFVKITKIGAGVSLSKDEEKMKKNIQTSLGVKLQQLSNNFKTSQREFLSKRRGMEAAGGEADPFLLDSDFSQYQDQGMSDDLVHSIDQAEKEAQQRDKELRNLLKSVEELNAIFKDIAILVIEQGSVLDRIDYNIENADNNLASAEEEIDHAIVYTKKSRTKICMIALCIFVLGAVLILVMKVALMSFIP